MRTHGVMKYQYYEYMYSPEGGQKIIDFLRQAVKPTVSDFFFFFFFLVVVVGGGGGSWIRNKDRFLSFKYVKYDIFRSSGQGLVHLNNKQPFKFPMST